MRIQRFRMFKKLYLEFFFSGLLYVFIEIVFRLAVGHKTTHPLVIILGGVAFLIAVAVCRIPTGMRFLWVKLLLGGLLLTAWEFLFGLIFNIYLGFDIWDYTGNRYEFMGQICLTFSLIWTGMMLLIIVIDHIIENKILKNSPYSFRALKRQKPEEGTSPDGVRCQI